MIATDTPPGNTGKPPGQPAPAEPGSPDSPARRRTDCPRTGIPSLDAAPSGTALIGAARVDAGPGEVRMYAELQPPALQARTRADGRRPIAFARTALGDQRVRAGPGGMPLHLARLLLLFEEPQAVDELRMMIDAAWLPEALVELERRGLLERVVLDAKGTGTTRAGTTNTTFTRASTALNSAAPATAAETAAATTGFDATGAMSATALPTAATTGGGQAEHCFLELRTRARNAFLNALGPLGEAMAERIGRCHSGAELEQLLPQVSALLLALAGRGKLARFESALADDSGIESTLVDLPGIQSTLADLPGIDSGDGR